MAAPDVDDGGRSERVLDAAAELLVRWGYRRVTIEDVARQAGIGKGTVYLHFRTKDALFLRVLLRVHRTLYADIADGLVADPALALPWRTMRFAYDRISADDIARPIYLGDPEVLGRLARESAATLVELGNVGADVLRGQFRLLRDAELIRTDLPLDEQIHCYGAVASGFFMHHLGAAPDPLPVRRRGELLEHTLAGLLGRPAQDTDPARLADVAPDLAALYVSLIEHLDAEWEKRTR